VLALVAAGAAAVGAAFAVGAMLADDDGSATRARAGSPVVVCVTVGALALAAAVAVGWDDAATSSAAAPDPTGAAQTVRGFLTEAALDGDAYGACEYMTSGERRQVARLAGQRQTCADALTGASVSLPGIDTEAALRRLDVRTAAVGRRVVATVFGAGPRPLSFTLERATPGERLAFDAPGAGWRIASGAAALLGAPGGASPRSHPRR
ncbi:MAG TPA: hypothetical protein VHF89_15110, partial [Solirubrobacteraceae bacterium]|nr:hypothetical protein [Solirubrobacteraceae bacterium]